MTARWTDLVEPTQDEVLQATARALDPDAVEMLLAPAAARPGARPMLEGHGSYVLAVLAFPRARVGEARVEYLELDVVASPEAVLTVRKPGARGDLAPVSGVEARVEAGGSPGAVFQAAVDDAADAFLELLDGLYEEIDALEATVERLSGTDVRRRLGALRHELLLARRASSATRGIARRVLDGRVDVGRAELFPPEVEAQFVDTYETLVRVTEELDVARDLLGGVRDYYQAKIAEQQNDVTKKLTVIASLVLVPSLIVGFYGQNFADEFRAGYWSVGVSLALIVTSSLAQVALFRWRRWI